MLVTMSETSRTKVEIDGCSNLTAPTCFNGEGMFMQKSAIQFEEEIHQLEKQLLVAETKLARAKSEVRDALVYCVCFGAAMLLALGYIIWRHWA